VKTTAVKTTTAKTAKTADNGQNPRAAKIFPTVRTMRARPGGQLSSLKQGEHNGAEQ
jgi:hypothetical protein